MKISLIVSDVDGTLLPEEENVEDGIRELARLIKENNLPFTLASGRPYRKMEALRKELGIRLPMVVCNGSGLWDGERYLWNRKLKTDEMRPVLEFADEAGMAVIVSREGKDQVFRKNQYIAERPFSREEEYRPESEEEWKQYTVQKLLIIDPGSPGRMESVVKKIRETTNNCQVVWYDSRGIEVMPKGCTKGQGVRELAEYLHIPLEELMVFGDNKNDLDMFHLAGFSVSVSNGVEEIKKAADYVTGRPCVYGVVEGIKKYCCGGQEERNETKIMEKED